MLVKKITAPFSLIKELSVHVDLTDDFVERNGHILQAFVAPIIFVNVPTGREVLGMNKSFYNSDEASITLLLSYMIKRLLV